MSEGEAGPIELFIHCLACAQRGQTERLDVGLTSSGLRVDCKKHGLVGAFTPAKLADLLARRPGCDCCPGGKHVS